MAQNETRGQLNVEPGKGLKATGKVQAIQPDRGFGFIRCTEGHPEDIGQDFFMHASGVRVPFTELTTGDLVVFLPTRTPKGRRAEEVERVL